MRWQEEVRGDRRRKGEEQRGREEQEVGRSQSSYCLARGVQTSSESQTKLSPKVT